MAPAITSGVAVAAAFLGGLLAGVAADKVVVAMPAWQTVGIEAWAMFTREADLGRGLFWYPAQGLTALWFTVATAVAFYFDKAVSRSASIPVYGGAVLAIIALFVTARELVPSMLQVRQAGDDLNTLRPLFDRVVFWWTVKSALHVATFAANLWSVVLILRRTP